MGNALEIFPSMYTDGIVLLGDTVLELQRKIRVLEEFCEKWGMEVNLAKTKVIVFRNGESCPSRRNSFTEGTKSRQLHTIGILGLYFPRETCGQKHYQHCQHRRKKLLAL